MQTTSFILAFAFMLAGPSMAGSSDQNLPGVGTFAYQGSPKNSTSPVPIMPWGVADAAIQKCGEFIQ